MLVYHDVHVRVFACATILRRKFCYMTRVLGEVAKSATLAIFGLLTLQDAVLITRSPAKRQPRKPHTTSRFSHDLEPQRPSRAPCKESPHRPTSLFKLLELPDLCGLQVETPHPSYLGHQLWELGITKP